MNCVSTPLVFALLALAGPLNVVLAQDSQEVLRWSFDEENEPGTWEGKGENRGEGPRNPRYPEFEDSNQAAYFPGRNLHLVVKDQEAGGSNNIRFGLGETLTLEAWVKVKSIGKGHQAYLIGKGRHAGKGEKLGDMNQNYAMRLKGDRGGAQLGFLFTSEHPETHKRDWHRWWSSELVSDSGWHHVSLVYTFGKGDSLQARIDGKLVEGTWDMGGATDLPPVTDRDDLVIGTGYGRRSSESFSGWMDNLVVHRGAVAPDLLASRFVHNPPPPPVTPEMVPDDRVLIQISEKGVPASQSWPSDPEVTETYEEEAFGLVDWPQKYVSTGVRGARANPSLVRAAGKIQIPKGKHRILLRGRGASRLTIDGVRLLETPFPPSDTDGHGKVSSQDKYLDLGPDFRFAPPGNRESWTEFETEGGEHFVVLETIIGGLARNSPRRPEFGETVAAISPEGEESWWVLSPGKQPIRYNDEGWAIYEARHRRQLAMQDAENRESMRALHSPYWSQRRKAAKSWLASQETFAVPEIPDHLPAHNEIDRFIGARIAQVEALSHPAGEGDIDYFGQVQPLLEARCYDCHVGGKAKGGLRVDQLSAMLKGGKYDGPAIVPGDPAASSLIFRVSEEAEDDIMPPKGEMLSAKEVEILEKWITEGARWPQFNVSNFSPTPLSSDLDFLRRVSLDTIGVPPSESEIEQFLADDPKERRSNAIDRLLDDDRWADHWMGYWQDVLAENPNLINPTLNNTGPFRWWIYESLLDNKPADLFVTELIRMEGSERLGGPAGFGVASGNDVPMAAKGMIIGSAFLGVEMKCARCHDAPSHVSKQEDLFQLAAMLKKAPIKLPATSSVPMDRIHQTGRKPLIQVTLKPGTEVKPSWPFARFCDEETAIALAENPDDSRDRLAAAITAPENERFAQVMVNRIWQRLMGRGIVEEVSDWEKGEASHPDLLAWLGRQLIQKDYDLKEVARLVLQSHAYQRAVDPELAEPSPLYIAAAPRRLTAEQIVDSLFAASGKPFELEEVSLDIDSVRHLNLSLSLGKPRRAWMLASTSNERDRPSLSLPRIQAVSSLMATFGWRGARQDPVSIRDSEANVLQPAILANGMVGTWLSRLSDDHQLTDLVLEEQSLDQLLERLFLRLLTRYPTPEEAAKYKAVLAEGYDSRVVPESMRLQNESEGKREPVRFVSWSNHLDGPANTLAQEKEAEARRGDPPTNALDSEWRSRFEDVLWAILNAPEWIYTP